MFDMHAWLEQINYWYWFALAIVLFIVEMSSGGGFLFWVGISAVLTGFFRLIMPFMTWPYQVLLFSLGAIVTAFLWWNYLRRHPQKTDKPRLNLRSEQYVGRIFTLEEAVNNGRGKIRVDDSSWRVECEQELPVGSRVRIVGVNGVVLIAEPVESV